MEELQAALKGNDRESSVCMSLITSAEPLSLDSLELSNLTLKSCKSQVLSQSGSVNNLENKESFYLNPSQVMSMGSSSISIHSEPTSKSKNRLGFIKSAMDEYLNSHRHSLSSVMELLDSSERQQGQTADLDLAKSEDQPAIFHELDNSEPQIPVRYSQDVSTCYCTLSPIEENSEHSTGSSRDTTLKYSQYPQIYSSSFNPIPSEPEYEDYPEKFQTFPRSKNGNRNIGINKNYYYETTMYPLEPRELDPIAFNQLHTADSQEELQEFLLLESECMNEKGKGLATAFVSSDDDDKDYFNSSLPGREGKLTIFFCRERYTNKFLHVFVFLSI